MKVILGSQSPRRKEILSYFSLPFTQVSPPFDEEKVLFQGDPQKYVLNISEGKANSLSDKYRDAIVITADTTVYKSGKIYGKPATEEDAIQALNELVGAWHTVFTAVSVQRGETLFSEVEATQVLFNDLTSEQTKHYIRRTKWADKAGGYAIQMAGGIIVRKIEGCYYNVMGLPINTLEALLKKVDIELWDYL